MTVSSNEQLMIELVNSFRLDPYGEAVRIGLTSQEIAALGLPQGSASPLAGTYTLHVAAGQHSSWMIANDDFSHTGAGGSSAGQRMEDAGYVFSGSYHWGENIGYRASSGTLDTTQAIYHLNRALILSDGHRANLLNPVFREVGIGQANGDYLGYDATMITQNFATSNGATFLTGVVYNDINGDDFYSVGEGVGGVTFSLSGKSDTTYGAGGYSVKVTSGGTQTVTIAYGTTEISAAVHIGSENVKLDLIDETVLRSSSSLTLLSGATDAVLLGLEDLSLYGNSRHNHLTGNAGDNMLAGGLGNDTIDGGAGVDTVKINAGSSEVTVEISGNDIIVTSAEGTDVYRNVEFFSFSNQTLTSSEVRELDPSNSTTSSNATSPGPSSSTTGLFIAGGDGADLLDGSNYNDSLKGGNGNDTLSGYGGDDNLPGGEGDDQVSGGAGNDLLGGGLGDDTLNAGAGNDQGGGGEGNDVINAGEGDDIFSGGAGNDLVQGADGHDWLAASYGNDTVTGGAGNDTIGAGHGHDRINGGAGDDQIGAGNHDDTLLGGDGNDFLGGGYGRDVLDGEAGQDTLNGGYGSDTLTGGVGQDEFVFNTLSGNGNDVITDFQVGIDHIKLVGLDLGHNPMQNLDIRDTANGAVIEYGDFTITVSGVSSHSLTADDFIF
ncbi:CAP domain-containing protein [Roseovarius faecimaris]|nr:CAP domain-containing protein [Roseovarius faecimaris]